MRRLTVGQAFTGAVAALGLVALLFFIAGAISLSRLKDAREELVDRTNPTRVNLERLQVSLLDQETGLRGFLLTADDQFLQPFRAAQTRERMQRARLQELVDRSDRAAVAQLGATLRSADAWSRGYALPAIAAVRRGERGARSARAALAGKERFDAFRAAAQAQSEAQTVRGTAARARLAESATRVNRVFYGFGALLLLAGIGVVVAMRRLVTLPLGRLAGDARRVAGGDYEHRVQSDGLVDMVALGADIEAMRRRIVDELASVGESNANLERSNLELEQFAYVASHDLQEPLRKVVSFSQLLQRRYGGQFDERADQYLDFAVDGARRMQLLINDLLAFSRVGRVDAVSVEVDLDTALDQALRALNTAIEETGARIEREPLPTVDGTPVLLSLVLQNLVGNAVKFRRPDVPPVVRITAEETGAVHEITVADNGIGIEPEYAERVFVIFQRLHGREQYEGTGIGLAMCRKIVEHHGGEIAVVATEGAGTTIRFSLPVRQAVPASVVEGEADG